jgi:hypothetical protein
MGIEFHPVLSPRVADQPDSPITLSFDDPDAASKVVVQIYEVDAWGSGPDRITETGGRDTLIAEMKGKILNKQFVLDSINPSGKTGSKPEMVLQIDGEDSTHSLPFPPSAIANEGGVFEVEARVSGVIGGKKRSGKTKVPVFLRNFKAGRPVVAFITGDPKADPFFAAADSYWKGVADGKFSLGSIEEIRSFLTKRADSGGYGSWGEANVVNHGNEFEWIVKLYHADRNVRHVHTADLAELSSDTRIFGAIPSLDDQSKVVIRGCAIGQDQALLDQIREVFGGDATILAPKYIQVYMEDSSGAREGFMETFFFYVPGSSAPGLDECKRRLGEKYPDVDDAAWLPMLKKTGKRLSIKETLDGYRHDRSENFPAPWTLQFTHDPGQKIPNSMGDASAFLKDVESQWTNDEKHANTDFDEWKWRVSPPRRTDKRDETDFAATVTGTRYRVEVRRELRDKDGKPVRPDITNHDHYGRSPAW